MRILPVHVPGAEAATASRARHLRRVAIESAAYVDARKAHGVSLLRASWGVQHGSTSGGESHGHVVASRAATLVACPQADPSLRGTMYNVQLLSKRILGVAIGVAYNGHVQPCTLLLRHDNTMRMAIVDTARPCRTVEALCVALLRVRVLRSRS